MTAESLIHTLYSAFNRRDADGALDLMTPDVSWPKASEGGRVIGKDEIRAYWTRQWAEFDPRVEPLAITSLEDGRQEVRIRQIVRTLAGETLSDMEVVHLYTLRDVQIARMDLDETVRAFQPAR